LIVPTVRLAAQVRLWDPKTGKPIGDALKGHAKWITSLAWEPCHMCVSAVRSASMHFVSNDEASTPVSIID
jgi:hypothetical protein